ncbi:MAG: Hypothetical protein BHV28_02330 [Candidatus Tokpelaia hoelldobleri]|uniref:Uncharacterized protein n=1 Tax=Candidatus Tokpelaia hoelldobleri TaxID=1902579 RepID=A0A1U9JSW9_9HYPH|nr:MAG: Hypothetical protein BHV28_02330 [Candidatus Tokpelaia hoelldoblerii]
MIVLTGMMPKLLQQPDNLQVRMSHQKKSLNEMKRDQDYGYKSSYKLRLHDRTEDSA